MTKKSSVKRIFVIVTLLLTAFSFHNHSFCMEKEVEVDGVKIENYFLVRNYSEKEDFDIVLGLLEWMPWFKQNGYDVSVPIHPVFEDLGENNDKIKNLDEDKYFKIFVSEVYKPLDLTPVQKILNTNSKILLMILDRFNTLNKKWGFKIFPKNEIILTMWGPGGRYYSDKGWVELRKNSKGFYSYRNELQMIVHEMVHIGIEELIVKEFKLSHWEKEGLVDLICEQYFGDLLLNYESQLQGDKKIREFVKGENIVNDLPATIKQYVTKYPREV